MKKEIPARYVTLCDICRCECTENNAKGEGKLIISSTTQPEIIDYDLCDLCLTQVSNFISSLEWRLR